MDFIIEHNEELHFFKFYCDMGHYITNFDEETMDILDFFAAKLIYCPDTVDVEATYHCITEEEYEEYEKRKEEAEELEEYIDEEMAKDEETINVDE